MEIDGDVWLEADYSLRCDDSMYARYQRAAFACIAIYVVGIPLVLLIQLRGYVKRNMLYAPEDEVAFARLSDHHHAGLGTPLVAAASVVPPLRSPPFLSHRACEHRLDVSTCTKLSDVHAHACPHMNQ